MKYTCYLFNSFFFLFLSLIRNTFFLLLFLGMSSGNSCTLESVFYDEILRQKTIEQQLTIPETVKLDLLIRTKTLGDNVN